MLALCSGIQPRTICCMVSPKSNMTVNMFCYIITNTKVLCLESKSMSEVSIYQVVQYICMYTSLGLSAKGLHEHICTQYQEAEI